MGLISFIKKVRIPAPSNEFIALIIATALATLFFSFQIHLESVSLDRINNSLRKTKIATLPYIEKVHIKPTVTQPEEINNNSENTKEVWGISEQISETTWTMKVGEDAIMGTPEDIHSALNSYRNSKGIGSLSWDEGLADLARKRAATFIEIGKLDEHAGFKEYVENEENMINLGFWGMGENSSIGFKLEGVHIIEWIFAGDPPHENNQLDSSWTHVGIGVNGTAVDVIFGKK